EDDQARGVDRDRQRGDDVRTRVEVHVATGPEVAGGAGHAAEGRLEPMIGAVAGGAEVAGPVDVRYVVDGLRDDAILIEGLGGVADVVDDDLGLRLVRQAPDALGEEGLTGGQVDGGVEGQARAGSDVVNVLE